MKKICLNEKQINILKILIINELSYYQGKEDIYEDDAKYIKELNEILHKFEIKEI